MKKYLSLSLLFLTGCGPAGILVGIVDATREASESVAATVTGTARYLDREATSSGLADPPTAKPIRFADIELINAETGAIVDSGSTDSSGQFSLDGVSGATYYIRVLARTNDTSTINLVVQNNSTDKVVHAVSSTDFNMGDNGTTHDVTASATSSAMPAAAFNILDVCVTGSEMIRSTTGSNLELLTIHWELGNSGDLNGVSHFTSSPSPNLNIVGGVSGLESTTNTDHFDDVIIGHEFGHFVHYSHGFNSGFGGSHGGENIYPSLAYSEGLATFLGSAFLNDPVYRDTIGDPVAATIQSFELSSESVELQRTSPYNEVDGIGSEFDCMEILWDLYDGVSGVEDSDGDGIAVSFADLFAVVNAEDSSTDYTYIGTFLEGLESNGLVTSSEITTLMSSPENHNISFPLTGTDVWPTAISVGDTKSGDIDSLTTDPSYGGSLM